MSSDGRYIYHQGLSSPYEYAPYPSSYESAQLQQQQPLRSMRSTSSQSHSPHPHPQPQYNPAPPQSPYQASYSSAPYTMPQQQQPPPPPPPQQQHQQWNETWSNYGQTFSPPPPIQELPFTSGPGRPESSMPSSSAEQRTYASNPDPRRADDRQVPPPTPSGPSAPPLQHKRRREKDSSPSGLSSMPSALPGLDFGKLLDTYRFIIDSTEAFSSAAVSGRPQPYDTMDRMLQSATYGAQMFDSGTNQPVAPPEIRQPVKRDVEETKEPTNGATKRQKPDDVPAQEGQTCLGCNATSTPEWRRGPMGPRTLCNACGLVYAKLIKKRSRESGRASGKSNGPGVAASQGHGDESGLASSGEGGSEDGDSYGSQDRRSDD